MTFLDHTYDKKHVQGTNYAISNDVQGMKTLLMDENFYPCDVRNNSYTWAVFKNSYEVFVLMVETRDIDLSTSGNYVLTTSIRHKNKNMLYYTVGWFIDRNRELELIKILKEEGFNYKSIIGESVFWKDRQAEIKEKKDALEKIYNIVTSCGGVKEYIQGESNYFVFYDNSSKLYNVGNDVNFFTEYQIYMTKETAERVVDHLVNN